MIDLDLTGRAPIYEQICSGLSELIATGVLKEDEKLPGARALAKELGLNPNTVSKAYGRLELEGIIYSVQGIGCFVAKQQGGIQKKLMSAFSEAASAALGAGIESLDLHNEIDRLTNKGSSEPVLPDERRDRGQ